jgi:hypothetical protein
VIAGIASNTDSDRFHSDRPNPLAAAPRVDSFNIRLSVRESFADYLPDERVCQCHDALDVGISFSGF